jgi:tetratricopeptide (TPR) repeat protein
MVRHEEGDHMRTLKMGLIATLCLSAPTGLFAFGAPPRAESQEEALSIRRIVELWKAQDYPAALAQIREFSASYPNSPFLDSFLVLQGDLDWRDHHYNEALHAYAAIQSPEAQERVFPHCVDCLYHTKNYRQLAGRLQNRVSSPNQSTLTDQESLWLYYYAEALRALSRYQEAEPLYVRLITTAYKTQAQVALASVSAGLGKPQKAAEIYLALAEALPDKREALLFKAAQVQATYDKELALRTFSSLHQQQGDKALAASFGELLLLYESEKYEELVKLANELEPTLPKEQLPLLQFFTGRSQFVLHNYAETLRLLQPLLNAKDKGNEKLILATLIASAQQLQRLDLAETWVARYESSFPKDPGLPKMRLLLAYAYKQAGKLDQALTALQKLIRDFPRFEELDVAYLEQGQLLGQQEKWDESRQAFLSLAERYPDSPHSITALKAVLQNTMKQLSKAKPYSPEAEDLRVQLSLMTNSGLSPIPEAEGRLRDWNAWASCSSLRILNSSSARDPPWPGRSSRARARRKLLNAIGIS